MSDVLVDDLIEEYTSASRGSLERALLMALDAGYEFTKVVSAMGNDGPRVAFLCLLRGWIDRGQITPAGRAHLQAGTEA